MQEPSCEGLWQPERPKGPRQPHPPTFRNQARRWRRRHVPLIILFSLNFYTTNEFLRVDYTCTKWKSESQWQGRDTYMSYVFVYIYFFYSSNKWLLDYALRNGNGNQDNTDRTTSTPPQARWRTLNHVFIYFLFFTLLTMVTRLCVRTGMRTGTTLAGQWVRHHKHDDALWVLMRMDRLDITYRR